MPEDKTKEEEVKSPEVTETEDGGVEVAVEQEIQKEPQEKVVQEKKEERKDTKEDALRNKVFAQDRLINKMRQELEDVRNIASSYQNKEQQVKTDAKLDELDELAQKDWKAAVSKLAEIKAREIYNSEQARIKESQVALQVKDELQRNVQMAVSKHPELDDPSSEKSVIFQSLLEKNPSLKTNPAGPLLVMYQMEDELRKKGYSIDNVDPVKKEGERINRIASTSLSPSRSTPSPGKVVLTREQKDFCDSNGITYADYARTLRSGGGIEI